MYYLMVVPIGISRLISWLIHQLPVPPALSIKTYIRVESVSHLSKNSFGFIRTIHFDDSICITLYGMKGGYG